MSEYHSGNVVIKKTTFFFRSISLIWLLLATSNLFSQTTYNIELVITGIKSQEGQIAVGVFKDDETFQDEVPFYKKKFEKKNIVQGVMRVVFSLNDGVYALSLLDDENSDGKMNYSFFGIPEEGFGFSNYYHTGFTKPHFDKFKFEVKDGQKQRITVRIRYI